MSRFTYLAMRESGERASGVLRGSDRSEAVRKLVGMGLHPISVQTAGQETAGLAQLRALYHRFVHRVRVADLAVFTRQLASLLRAGLPMVQALSTLRRQCGHRGLAVVLEELESSIGRDASSLAEALDAHPRVFGPVYRGLVRSGEEGGRLDEVLQDLATHLSRSARLRGQVLGAFIYPIFLLVLGTAAIFVLMAFVIPKFQDLFSSFGQTLPLPTRVLITVSGFLDQWWWAVLAGLAAAVLLSLLALRRQPVRAAVDRRVLGLPVFGPMVIRLEVARIARTLSALLGSGVRILIALRLTGEAAQNLAVKQTFSLMQERVARGEPLADAVQASGIYPVAVINLIQTGEETGELSEMLTELAAIYEEEAERAVNGAVKLLEPALIVVMGLIIAGIVSAVILPIFQSNAMVG